MVNELFKELSQLEQVEAIALGGSRATNNNDEKSDYDVYLYVTRPIAEQVRKDILSKYCKYMEIGNHYWEYEDNCVLNNDIDIDILYRDLDDFANGIKSVVEDGIPSNCYTTCMWHNLLTCKIIYDESGRLAQIKERFNVPYPAKLKQAIIERQLDLLSDAMPAFSVQIEKAVKRDDYVSVNHRVTEFLASYFDLIFAINELTHPGEKRLMALCKRDCKVLPENFEESVMTTADSPAALAFSNSFKKASGVAWLVEGRSSLSISFS